MAENQSFAQRRLSFSPSGAPPAALAAGGRPLPAPARRTDSSGAGSVNANRALPSPAARGSPGARDHRASMPVMPTSAGVRATLGAGPAPGSRPLPSAGAAPGGRPLPAARPQSGAPVSRPPIAGAASISRPPAATRSPSAGAPGSTPPQTSTASFRMGSSSAPTIGVGRVPPRSLPTSTTNGPVTRPMNPPSGGKPWPPTSSESAARPAVPAPSVRSNTISGPPIAAGAPRPLGVAASSTGARPLPPSTRPLAPASGVSVSPQPVNRSPSQHQSGSVALSPGGGRPVPPPAHRDRSNLSATTAPAHSRPAVSPPAPAASQTSFSPSHRFTMPPGSITAQSTTVPPARPLRPENRPAPPIGSAASPGSSSPSAPQGSPSVRPPIPVQPPASTTGGSTGGVTAPTTRPVTMIAPHGLAGALRLPGATPLEMKDLKKETKKRDKRMTLTSKDIEKKKEKEEKEQQKKEKEAERERERKEKEERKRKEKEEKEALKAKEREDKESTRALGSSLPVVSSSNTSTPTITLSVSDPAPTHASGSKGTDKGSSKRRTMLFGKRDSLSPTLRNSAPSDQSDLRSLLETTGSGGVAGGVLGSVSAASEKKERTFNSLNEVLSQGSVSDLKKFVKLHNCASRLVGEILNQDGQIALHIACSRYGDEADPAMVKYVLKQKGINTNAKDNLHAGADATSPNVDGTRPLDYFVRHGPKDGQVEQFEMALELLLKGNSVNFRNPASGETALHNAIRSGHSGNLHTIKMLLARAADVSVLNAVGETPLHYAVKVGRPDIVDLLLSAGADPRQEGAAGVGSPLALAEAMPESAEKNYLLRQLKKQVSVIQAQEMSSPRQLLAAKLEEAKEKRQFAERMLKAKEGELAQLNAQVTEEQQREQTLQAELERLKLMHQNLLAQRRRV